jgi:TPR repeat protein
MQKSAPKLDALEILDWVSLAPLIAFKNPSDFWLDAGRLRPIDDLELRSSIANRLSSASFWYISDLEELSLAELSRRSKLDSGESEELRSALEARRIKLPEHEVLRREEKFEFLMTKYANDIRTLKEAANRGSDVAALYLAKISQPDEDEHFYRIAIQLGSAQAANDLAATLHQKKSYDPKLIKEILSLYEYSAKLGLPEALFNLATAEINFRDKTESDVADLYKRAAERGVARESMVR